MTNTPTTPAAIDALVARMRSSIGAGPAGATPMSVPPAKAAPPALSDYPEHALLGRLQSLYGDGRMRNPYFVARSGPASGTLNVGDAEYVTFSNYNYLDLATDPRVVAAAQDAVGRYGCHAGAARMVGGEIALHAELESALADYTGFEAVSVGVGGYSTNVSVIGYLLDRRDLILHDSYMHNSAVMGAVLSGARRMAFPHNDMEALERLLAEHSPHARRTLILVEGAYSMDGDLVDLPRAVALRDRYDTWLMVDEAHSVGTVGQTGRGVCEHFGVPTASVDLMIGTLSKSFASCGGFVAGRRDLLHHFCPGLLLYSTGISPANTAAALAAVRIAAAEPERVTRLQVNAARLRELVQAAGLDCRTAEPGVPIVPIMIDDDAAAPLMSTLLDHGVIAHAVMHPVVPRDAARLRCFVTAGHDEAMMTRAVDVIARCLSRPTPAQEEYVPC
jgi:8-amino-7-oxononanoate synthase